MNIKERRKELGKTQMDMAKETGVSLQAYILWERGINTPTCENMEKLKLALGFVGDDYE